MSNGPIASDELRLLIERIERLEEEKKGVADDIRDVYAEAKGRGFDPKTMRAIVRLRKMDPNDRREYEAMLDIYKGALGMLDGTPLGNWAVERLKKDSGKPDEEKPDDAAQPADGDDAADPEGAEPEPELTIEDARRLGGEAAREGKPVTSNPFPARDARRAAWDEAWCQALGSDGMDIPAALKPTPKPKAPGKPDDGAPEA